MCWVSAGVGAADLLRQRQGNLAGVLRPGCAVALGALASLHLPALLASAHAPEGGIPASTASALDLTDSYLPFLADSRQAAVLSNLPMKFLAQWTYAQRYDQGPRLETDIRGYDPHQPQTRRHFDQWLMTTHCDTVVCVDIARGAPFYVAVPGSEELESYAELLNSQNVFQLAHRAVGPEHGYVVTVWKRSAPAAR
jgi:hypothetical protein